MKTPRPIKLGSKFRIVSPAGKVDMQKVRGAASWLESQGYKVEFGKNVFEAFDQFAGTDLQRAEDLQTALDDSETDVILCSRGGYGTIRIIDKLDFTGFQKNPKWLVGFSDITVLHSCLHNLDFASIHGTMPRFFLDENGKATGNLITLLDLLTAGKPVYDFEYQKYNRAGNASGQLVGGNLSILCSLIGTKYDLDTSGKILFIEDIDEYLYHIDRMMHQLKQAGKLRNLKALVVGDFSDIKDNETPFGKTFQEIINEAVEDYSFPVSFGFPAGHEEKNLGLIFGKTWHLDVADSCSTMKLL